MRSSSAKPSIRPVRRSAEMMTFHWLTIAIATVRDPELPGLSFFTARFAHSMWTSAKSLQ